MSARPFGVLTTAVDIINCLAAAQTVGRLKLELKRYLKPALLALDGLGYLPIDKAGADLLFQIFGHRYERGALLITTNQPYKQWPKIFNNDTTITSAVLDRLLHRFIAMILRMYAICITNARVYCWFSGAPAS